ncbi:MAG: peptidoglycan DD-metalloendopeptidase family protein [Lachnospiraceae bacterium]|nr:peptidoglycan DD-metalloendopeptidase family protein [Lachnospiraceae bacterium]
MMEQQEGIAENLENVEAQLVEDKRVEGIQYNAMKLRIKYLYEHGSYTFMDALAGSTSFGDMLNRTTLASQIQVYDKEMLQTYRDSLTAITEKEEYISSRKAHLERITNNLKDERDAVIMLDEAKKRNLERLNKNIANFSNLVDFYKQSENDLEAQIAAAEVEIYDDFDGMPVKYKGDKLLWPTPGYYRISSPFGMRMHPILHYARLHAGIDIDVPSGVGIYAAAKGKVIISTYDSGAGNYVMIDHGDGLCTVYMHNSKLLVKAGDTVKKGQKIALSGSTGLSTGPHCHFGVRLNGTYVNPLKYFKSTTDADEDDYSDSDVMDTYEKEDDDANVENDDSDNEVTKKKKDDSMSDYKKQADDQGDNGKKSSELEDDGDSDSE